MQEERPLARDHLEGVLAVARKMLRWWWVTLVVLVLGAAAITLAVTNFYPARYRSQAVLYYQEGIQWDSEGGQMSARRVGQRLKDMVLARAPLTKIIEEMKLFPLLVEGGQMADAVDRLREATTFKVNEGGDIFVLGYTGDTPDEVQGVTSRLAENMIEENKRFRAAQAEVTEGFLNAETKRNEADLQMKERELYGFLTQHPEFAAEQGGGGAAVRATTKKPIDPGPVTSDPALLPLRREEERLRKQITTPADVRPRQDPILVAAKSEAEAKVAQARRDLNDKQSRFTDQHPDVRAAMNVFKEAEIALQRASNALKASDAMPVEGMPPATRAALEARLLQVQEEIRDYQRKKVKDPGPNNEINDSGQRIVALETEFNRLSRAAVEARERFEQLDSRQFKASIAASSLSTGQSARIEFIDPAYKPTRPIGVSPIRLMALGVIGSLALGLSLAFMLALLDDRVYVRGDVEKIVPVLVEIPHAGLTAKAATARR